MRFVWIVLLLTIGLSACATRELTPEEQAAWSEYNREYARRIDRVIENRKPDPYAPTVNLWACASEPELRDGIAFYRSYGYFPVRGTRIPGYYPLQFSSRCTRLNFETGIRFRKMYNVRLDGVWRAVILFDGREGYFWGMSETPGVF